MTFNNKRQAVLEQYTLEDAQDYLKKMTLTSKLLVLDYDYAKEVRNNVWSYVSDILKVARKSKIANPDEILEKVRNICSVCGVGYRPGKGNTASHWDVEGYGYCEEHYYKVKR